jgi:ATP-dependent DNA helicase RecG
MSIPTDAEILTLLDRLATHMADELESQWLDFKPWHDAKDDMKVAVESAVCFANAEGGVIVFGVADQTRGRSAAIRGVHGHDLDTWQRGIYAATVPHLSVDIEELAVPEGTGKLLVVRVPKGPSPPYGTAQGLFKIRVGKNCMPLYPASFTRDQIRIGAIDWSGQLAEEVSTTDLDPLEIARAKNILRRINPDSELLKLDDKAFLVGLGAVRNGKVTHAGLLLFGREQVLTSLCPQHQVHYVHLISDTSVARNDSYRFGLLNILERLEWTFTSPVNPEQELSVGFFKLRIPAFPWEVVREAVLNAVTHRDYSDPGEVLIRHTNRELVVSNPGGFIGGITPQNILRHEPISRNRTLAAAFEKLRLVEQAGTGRRRIFIPMLSYGKQMPKYETQGERVVLRIFNGSFDQRLARLVAKWKQQGLEIDLDGLLVLSFLRDHDFVDTVTAAELLQLPRDSTRAVLDQLAQPRTGILERRGKTKAASYYLSKGIALDLLGKTAYTKTKGLEPIRYAEMVKAFLADHGAITPQECRELLGLGESDTARVEVSRYLKQWSSEKGFLRREGKPPKVIYYPRKKR